MVLVTHTVEFKPFQGRVFVLFAAVSLMSSHCLVLINICGIKDKLYLYPSIYN